MGDLNSRGISYPASFAGSTFCQPCYEAGLDRLWAAVVSLDETEVDDIVSGGGDDA